MPIDVGTEINLSFSTKNESGIILLGSGGAPAPRRKRRQTGQVLSAVHPMFSLMLSSNCFFIIIILNHFFLFFSPFVSILILVNQDEHSIYPGWPPAFQTSSDNVCSKFSFCSISGAKSHPTSYLCSSGLSICIDTKNLK